MVKGIAQFPLLPLLEEKPVTDDATVIPGESGHGKEGGYPDPVSGKEIAGQAEVAGQKRDENYGRAHRGDKAEERAGAQSEDQDEGDVDQSFANPAANEVILQNIINEIGVDLNSRVSHFLKRRHRRVANANCRGTDQNQLALKSFAGSLCSTTSESEYVGNVATGPMKSICTYPPGSVGIATVPKSIRSSSLGLNTTRT